MKILNLYANIGGNRKLWGDEHEITAVELNPKIAAIYQEFWPNDTVIVADAHQYLLDHYKEFDFIWSSPPCPSHSRIRNEAGVGSGQNEAIYPDMKLYEEIILLQHMTKLGLFKGKYCIENVISYYEPLIPPVKMAEHYFWTNFILRDFQNKSRNHFGTRESLEQSKGFDLSKYKGIDKRLMLRDCTEPALGKHILDLAINPIELQPSMF
jgi:DNA (cytosine-5)-methyltransferase 1